MAAEEVAGHAGDRADARISNPDAHHERCVHRLFTTPIPKRTARVSRDRADHRRLVTEEQVGEDRRDAPRPNAAPITSASLQRRPVRLLDRQPELLLDHRLEHRRGARP